MATFTDERNQNTTHHSQPTPSAPKSNSPISTEVWFHSAPKQYWQAAIDLLFPPQCISCQRIGWNLCPLCAQSVSPPTGPLCRRCGRMQSNASETCALCTRIHDWALTRVRAATLFQGPIHPAIHALKYDGKKELAAPLARYLVTVLHQMEYGHKEIPIDFIVPVPLHAERMRERGYNQAELLAQAVSNTIGIPMLSQGLTRIQFDKSQVNLSFEERQLNVQNAFHSDADLAQKSILLIDDVYTTGATLNACAKALRRAGAINVVGLTLSMPVKQEQL